MFTLEIETLTAYSKCATDLIFLLHSNTLLYTESERVICNKLLFGVGVIGVRMKQRAAVSRST